MSSIMSGMIEWPTSVSYRLVNQLTTPSTRPITRPSTAVHRPVTTPMIPSTKPPTMSLAACQAPAQSPLTTATTKSITPWITRRSVLKIAVAAWTTPPMIWPTRGMTAATISISRLNAATTMPPTSVASGPSTEDAACHSA